MGLKNKKYDIETKPCFRDKDSMAAIMIAGIPKYLSLLESRTSAAFWYPQSFLLDVRHILMFQYYVSNN